MPDNNVPLPSPPLKKNSRFPGPLLVILILFIVFLAGTLIGFDTCGKSESGSQTGFYIFSISALGLFVTTVGGFISSLGFILDKFDSWLSHKKQVK